MKKKTIFLLIGGIGLIILIVVLLLFFGIPVNTNSKLVSDVYPYLGVNDLNYCEGLVTYSDELVNYDKINSQTRICQVVALLSDDKVGESITLEADKKNDVCKINEDIIFATDDADNKTCNIMQISKEEIKKEYQKIFGQELTKDENFLLNQTTTCYFDEDNYYCGLPLNYTILIGKNPQTYRFIKSASKKNDQLIIYDYFLKIASDKCYTTYNETKENQECTNAYKTNKEIDQKFLKKYGTKYKHTFKKVNKDEYIWVQSEIAS